MNKTAAAKTTNRKINMDGRNHNLLDIIKFKCFHALALAYCIHTCNQPTRACCLFHTYGQLIATGFAIRGPVAQSSLPVSLQSSDIAKETFRKKFENISV